jgi:regulator of sigma E protease
MLTFIIFIAVLSVLVLVHEAGHFIVAKRTGMKVEEFGLGFPPRLWSFRYNGTIYSINLILFGGFVRIFGEEGEQRNTPGSFGYAGFWSQLAVVFAGVAMNMVLAAVLLMISNFGGLRVGLFDEAIAARATDKKVQILQVSPDSPAAIAQLRALDEIYGFRTTSSSELVAVTTSEEVQKFAFQHQGDDVIIVIRRGDEFLDVPIHLRETLAPGQGPIGISLALTGVIRHSWYQSIWLGITDSWHLFRATVQGYWGLIASLFTTGKLGADISGPIGIAALTGQAAQIGFTYLLQFMAMISVNLAVLNVMPFPALDGGRAVMIIAQRIRGRALRESTERTIHALGFIFLLMLMVAVTIKDIVKFF